MPPTWATPVGGARNAALRGIFMTMKELSKEYKIHANLLSIRIEQLKVELDTARLPEKEQIEERIRMLSIMRDEANELSKVTAQLNG